MFSYKSQNMKKIFLSAIIAVALLSASARAQEAVLHSDGSQEIRTTDASGKMTSVNIPKGESLSAKYIGKLQIQQQDVAASGGQGSEWVSHEAILLKDGSQEIHFTDPSGKERVVSAAKGESVQAKYRDLLIKEGIPCGCSNPAAAPSAQVTKTATLPVTPSESQPDQKK